MSLTGAVFQLRKYSQGLKNWMGYLMFWKKKNNKILRLITLQLNFKYENLGSIYRDSYLPQGEGSKS